MSDPFQLDPRLAADTFLVGETPLSQVLLMNDARYPWLILVPRLSDVTEPFQLSEADQAQLWQESMRLGEAMKAHFAADKLNIAALGNQVAQLHVHHIEIDGGMVVIRTTKEMDLRRALLNAISQINDETAKAA